LEGEAVTTVHKLKTWPVYFWAIASGDLTGCVRRDDRGYDVGDLVELHEWVAGVDMYTGRVLTKRITHVLRDLEGIQPGYAGLSFGAP
jgi:hypothetical protein